MLQAIRKFCARHWKKQQEVNARRHPDKNICCKCGYDLTNIAEPPPAKCAVNVVCPECGSPVALRENKTWRNDGKYSITKLLVISSSWAIGSVVSVYFLVPILDSRFVATAPKIVKDAFHIGGIAPMASLILIGPIVMSIVAGRGTVIRSHVNRRGYTALAPFWIMTILYFSFGGMVFKALGQ